MSNLRFGQVLCARPSGSRTHSLTNVSWMNWRRARRPILLRFRVRHLSDPRLIDVVKAAAKAANWDARPSPKPRANKTGIAIGRGVACVAYEGDNGYAAMVAEVEVDQDTGKVTVKRIVTSNDSGPISNPDGLKNQMEGGALQGMSRALMEEVTWDDQKVTSVNWKSYRTLPLGFDVPKIDDSPRQPRPDLPAQAREKRQSLSSRPQSETQSSTPPAPASARFRSRPNASRPRWPKPDFSQRLRPTMVL